MRPSAFPSWGDHSEGQYEAPMTLRLSQGPEDSSPRGHPQEASPSLSNHKSFLCPELRAGSQVGQRV